MRNVLPSLLFAACSPYDPGLLGPTQEHGTSLPTGGTTPTHSLCELPQAGRALCVSEVQADNDATVQLGEPGDFPDWIELQNRGDLPIRPSDITVIVGDEDPVTLDGDELAPGAVRLWSDDVDVPDDGAPIEVRLGDLLADRIELPPLSGDTSWSRQDDGSFALECGPTPGAANLPAVPCDDARDWVFAAGRVHDLWLYLDSTAWGVLETSSTFVHPGAYGRLVFAGGEFPVVQVEEKGGYGSFRADLDTQKVAFKIDLDRVEPRKWHGLQKIVLNNLVQDPTFLHEWLTYEAYRVAGIPAPRVSYARLHVNDVYFGFYALIEAVDGPFLDTWWADGSGHLLEAAYGPDFDPGEEVLFEYDQGPDEVAGRAHVAEVANLLAASPWDEATYATLRGLVDMDQVLRNMAVEAATWNWDGYTTENNSYWYEDPTTGLWQLVPHGVDQTWVDGWPNAYDVNSRPVLYDFCLRVPSCTAMYEQQLLEVADALEARALEPELDALIALTQPDFDADPRKEDAGSRTWELDATRARILAAPQALRDAAAVNGP